MGKALKFLGAAIAVGSIVYKVILFTTYSRSITDWWGSMIVLYFLLYATSVCTILGAFLKESASGVISICMLVFCALFLSMDFLSYLGFAVSLNNTPMTHMGITPLANVILIVANICILIGSLIQEKKKKTATNTIGSN